ncbi:MAG: hypothetical protein HY741_17065 [Chloroflexi bacterium]|nr:hypothetical protein [Chloroflexota bacterium]
MNTRNLRRLREQGEAMNREELDMFVPLTIEESVAEFLVLYNTFALMLDETEDSAREQDEIYFSEMAMRLDRSRRKKTQHAQSISQRRALPEAS